MFRLPPGLTNPTFTGFLDEIDRAGFGSLRPDAGLILMCFLAGYTDRRTRQATPHVLLEGLNGTAKTMLTSAIVDVLLGLRLRLFYRLSGWDKYARTAGSPDQSPADLIGFDQPGFDPAGKQCLVFVPGPILQNKLVHYNDELNRSPPKAQSVWLEPMAEGGPVTITTLDPNYRYRRTWRLRDFWLIASQNPETQEGTFPLPEAMADRFLVKITMRYTRQLAELIRDGGPQGPPTLAAAPRELIAELAAPGFAAALTRLAGHADLLADVEEQGPTVRSRLESPHHVEDIVQRLTRGVRDATTFEETRQLEAVLLAVRRAELRTLQEEVKAIPFPDAVAEYTAGLVYDCWTRTAYTQAVGEVREEDLIPIDPALEARIGEDVAAGPSPRAALALRALGKSYAWATRGPNAVACVEDIDAVACPVLRHRLLLRFQAAMAQVTTDQVLERILTYRKRNRQRPPR